MIRAVVIVNQGGKTRFAKFFDAYSVTIQQQIIRDTYLTVSRRNSSMCNFLSATDILNTPDVWLIYRQYALLYFAFYVDSTESELGILDLIQVFVETLDESFEGVSELDLIFHNDKTERILEEIVMGGLVLQIDKSNILAHYNAQRSIEQSEGAVSKASAAVKSFARSNPIMKMSNPNATNHGYTAT